jgi:hypothetical protein
MRDVLPRRSFRVLALAAAAVACSTAFAANQTAFWLEPRNNATFDRQVTEEVGKRAGLIVLRARWNHPDPDYTLKAVVARFKADTKAPVLSYSGRTVIRMQGGAKLTSFAVSMQPRSVRLPKPRATVTARSTSWTCATPMCAAAW